MISSRILLFLSFGVAAVTGRSSKPNFIFIITDDQDLHLNSLDYQPAVQKHFAQEGGYPRFIEEGFNDAYLPVWLQEAGYNTYYTGKLMNGHSISTYDAPRANGWNSSDFLIDPGTYVFYNSTMTRNHDVYRNSPGEYSTDLVANAAVSFLDEAIAAPDRPFFIGVAPIAPHSETITNPRPTKFNLPVPAKRHEHLFPDVKVPRTPNFNPSKPGTASYFSTLRPLNASEIAYNDAWYRARLQTLQSVDDLIESIMNRLSETPEVLENTYLIYTTDNGFHISQHRLPPGKSCGIEEDINIPFFIRGPGVSKGAVMEIPSSHTDIVPTLFHLAGIPAREDFDGEVIPVTGAMQEKGGKSEHVNVEFWGEYLVEGNTFYGRDVWAENTYKTVRVVGEELGGMGTDKPNQTDPYQLTNLLSTPNATTTITSYPILPLTARLDALLLTLKRCKGRVCTRPWEKLHPEGNVRNLKDAMHERYDVFYLEKQKKVSFDECALGQILEVEGPLEPVSWREEWDEWSWGT
ncbi:uncharacterized protein J4E79_007629 [Alternaria viburni]|uniref:uncharacterized protein n=1 Tax=Alternaria viburni TaxID=566460 RepID=UPI0020C26DE2|nr:uncharacterized protein J4E79_007629 [Alternaria viburni]KAI4657014.1 hypothetical protein J4E79_007629 [Alternaria viburni]